MSKQNSTTKNANNNTIGLEKVFDGDDIIPETWKVTGWNEDIYTINVEKEGDKYRCDFYYVASETNFWREDVAYGATPLEAANNVLDNCDVYVGMEMN